MGKVSYGDSFIWGKCYMGKVAYVENVMWGKCDEG